jgi:hypothetical protein
MVRMYVKNQVIKKIEGIEAQLSRDGGGGQGP